MTINLNGEMKEKKEKKPRIIPNDANDIRLIK